MEKDQVYAINWSRFAPHFVALLLLLTQPQASQATGVLPDRLDYTFKLYSGQATFDTPMPVAFDGKSYWGASGGSPSSPLQQYDPKSGDVVASYISGIDFRSTFSDAIGTVYASGYADNQIYQMVAPGKFTSLLTLSDIAPHEQAPVIFSPDGAQYASRIGNQINLWSAKEGSWQAALELSDYGTRKGEDALGTDQTDLNLAAFGSYYLTYIPSTNEVNAWDSAGKRVGTMELGENNQATAYSFGVANGYVFTNDESSQQYRGYVLPSSKLASSATAPEPGTIVLSALGLLMLSRRRWG